MIVCIICQCFCFFLFLCAATLCWCCQFVWGHRIYSHTPTRGHSRSCQGYYYMYLCDSCCCVNLLCTVLCSSWLCSSSPSSLARQLSPFASHSGQTLRTTNQSPIVEQTDISSSSTTTSSSSSPLPPGHERCSYCGSVMPSLRLIMHERHCMQSTFKCPLCKWESLYF